MSAARGIRFLQLQTHVYENKEANLEQARGLIRMHAEERPDFVCLGEMFACPYDTKNFPVYAEADGGKTDEFLSRLAAEYGTYLSAGSVPERDSSGRIFNTACVYDPAGKKIAKHRKMHQFDIDVKNGQHFRESETLTAGDQVTVFDTEFGKMGLCICFDFRFPELARLMALKGAELMIVPAAFNMTTGPAHWETMHRSRAIDNQCFVVSTSPACDMSASYHAYGHSIVVSPWGNVISETDETECSALTELDLSEVKKIREQLPLLSARRTDVYELKIQENLR